MIPVNGYLELFDKGYGFLRSIDDNLRPSPEDPFVPAQLINKWNMAEGALIHGAGAKGTGKNRNLKLATIETVNGLSLERHREVRSLQEQISIDPSSQLRMSQGPDDLMGRALDWIVPIGRGQRGLVVSPPKTGKTTILKHMASSILTHYPDTQVFVLLVDERPEEVTDFKRSLENARVLHSSADQDLIQHMRITRFTMNIAIRYAEVGQDAVVFIDSLTRMARAFNADTRSHGRTMSGGLAAGALEIPRRIFGAARNIEDGGSLTVIATILVETGSRMDDIIFQEFKGTGNMDLMLSRKCAEQRVWPAININDSGTRKEHLLLSESEYKEVADARRWLSQRDEVSAMTSLLEFFDAHRQES
ncbi:MAG: transcription termination factor Rho [Pseudomonadota bacterium]